MEALLEAIEAKFAASAALAGSVNGLFFERLNAPQALPLIQCQILRAKPRLAFEGTAFEEVVLRFTIVSDKPSRTEVMEIYEKLRAAYDFAELSVEGHSPSVMLLDGAAVTREGGAWRCAVDYRVRLE